MRRLTEREIEIAEKRKLCSANLTIRTPYISQETKADRRHRSYVQRFRRNAHRREERALARLLGALVEDDA